MRARLLLAAHHVAPRDPARAAAFLAAAADNLVSVVAPHVVARRLNFFPPPRILHLLGELALSCCSKLPPGCSDGVREGGVPRAVGADRGGEGRAGGDRAALRGLGVACLHFL